MSVQIFEINHSEFGKEEFQITNSQYNLYHAEESIWEFVISFETDMAIKRVKELEEVIDPLPNFEATVLLTKDQTALEPSQTLTQKEGYDYKRDEYLSNVYYFEHNTVENLKVHLEKIGDDFLTATIEGKAIINGSNGNEPDAGLILQSITFRLNPDLQRQIT